MRAILPDVPLPAAGDGRSARTESPGHHRRARPDGLPVMGAPAAICGSRVFRHSRKAASLTATPSCNRPGFAVGRPGQDLTIEFDVRSRGDEGFLRGTGLPGGCGQHEQEQADSRNAETTRHATPRGTRTGKPDGGDDVRLSTMKGQSRRFAASVRSER